MSQLLKSMMPLCGLPNVTRFLTGGLLHVSTQARMNCPPWEKPMALIAGAALRIGSSAMKEQAVAISSVRLPKKVAC